MYFFSETPNSYGENIIEILLLGYCVNFKTWLSCKISKNHYVQDMYFIGFLESTD